MMPTTATPASDTYFTILVTFTVTFTDAPDGYNAFTALEAFLHLDINSFLSLTAASVQARAALTF